MIKDYTMRLGVKGICEIMKHGYFKNVKWQDVMEKAECDKNFSCNSLKNTKTETFELDTDENLIQFEFNAFTE